MAGTKKIAKKPSTRSLKKKPNQWKLYDSYGNVWEWCYDRYGDYSTESKTDPVVLNKGKYRVIRGGDFSSSAKNCRSANRNRKTPNTKKFGLGFRVVLAPQIKCDVNLDKHLEMPIRKRKTEFEFGL